MNFPLLEQGYTVTRSSNQVSPSLVGNGILSPISGSNFFPSQIGIPPGAPSLSPGEEIDIFLDFGLGFTYYIPRLFYISLDLHYTLTTLLRPFTQLLATVPAANYISFTGLGFKVILGKNWYIKKGLLGIGIHYKFRFVRFNEFIFDKQLARIQVDSIMGSAPSNLYTHVVGIFVSYNWLPTEVTIKKIKVQNYKNIFEKLNKREIEKL